MLPLIMLLCFQVVHSQQRILYVKNSSQCPDDTTECHTLDWYSNNYNVSFISNTIMLFEEGTHFLSNFIKVSNCHGFTMTGNGSAMRDSDGLPQPRSKISCSAASTGGLLFYNSSNIHIKNLELRFCSGSYTLKEEYDYAGSLVFVSVLDISLVQVVISNTKGYGLHAVNTFGTNEVYDSAFLNASKHPNIRDSGNMNLFYSEDVRNIDTTLVVNSSWFMYGEDSNAAGGLSIYINHDNVHITIVNVTAKGNTGSQGGNLALLVVLDTINSSSIDISNSRIMDGRAKKGAGVKFWSIQNQNSEGSFLHTVHPILSVRSTLFNNNSAKITGGAMYMSYTSPCTTANLNCLGGIGSEVLIRNCSFTENTGNGAAMEIVQFGYYITHLIQTSIENCMFEGNFDYHAYAAPVLDFILVEISVINCTFTGSNSTLVSLKKSHLKLSGDIWFENNTATQVVGGALRLCEASLLFVHNNTHIHFVNNSALKGGAIYVQQFCMETTPLCFIQPLVPEDMSVMDFIKFVKFEFINNSAEVAGDILYGGDIDQCTMINSYYGNTSERHSVGFSMKVFIEMFETQRQYGPSSISSDPRGVCFCYEPQQSSNNQTCTTSIDPLYKYPGEEFTVSVVTVGQMNGSTFGTVVTSLVDENQNHNLIPVRMGNNETSAKCRKLTFTLNSNSTGALIHFKPVTSEFATTYDIILPNVTVHLLQCPLGFQLTNSPPFECVCNFLLTKFLSDSQVKCDVSNKTISVKQRKLWFGCFDHDQEKQNQSTACDSLIVAQNCDYYCSTIADDSSGVIRVPVTDLDSQCSIGHTGILCGACKPGYSRVLGGTLECRKDCTNAYLPLLILVFLASSILLVIIIMVLNLTVTEGTLNGLLVYTTVIQTHRSYFPEHQSMFGQFCWVFTSWINLMFGIKTCFYNGMDGYQHIWVLFAQAFYFLFVIMIIILLSRRFIFFTRLLRRNIIKVLATLAAMLYSNLMFATFSTFKYATLHVSTSNGTQYSQVAWFYDGNVPYFGLKHAPLFTVALTCSIVMILFVFSLLLIQCLQKRSHFFFFFWVDRFRPFFEAYTGPCHDSYRFWPGFLFFMRTAIYSLDSFIPAYTNDLFQIKMFITAAVFVVIMSLACIFPQGVYKRWPINVLEFSFYLNLCITSGILGLKSNSRQSISTVVYTSVSISAFTFFGILIYHIYGQIMDTTGWKRLTTWCTHIHRKPIDTTKLNSDDEKTPLFLPQAIPTEVSFDNSIKH